MDQMRAVVNMLCDPSRENGEKPLMLETVLFCPLLAWAGEKLKADGVRRFFIVCGPKFAEGARACFAPEEDVTVSGDRAALEAFLAEDGPVAVLPCPALPVLSRGRELRLYGRGRGASRRLADCRPRPPARRRCPAGPPSPLWGSSSAWSCAAGTPSSGGTWPPASGSWTPAPSIWTPGPKIGRGTVVLPGTILRGADRHRRGLRDRPQHHDPRVHRGRPHHRQRLPAQREHRGQRHQCGALCLRPAQLPHRRADIKVGDFVEVKNSTIGDGTKISHLTYVGDSDVGEKVNFGCGTVTTNYDGFKKYRCTIGDGAFIGCNTNLIAPVNAWGTAPIPRQAAPLPGMCPTTRWPSPGSGRRSRRAGPPGGARSTAQAKVNAPPDHFYTAARLWAAGGILKNVRHRKEKLIMKIREEKKEGAQDDFSRQGHQIFSGNSNQKLAEEICKLMGTKLGEAEVGKVF
jgi:bifunctional UDP-N-acetylglucosamine pyrophosphorylase/glucosamine-1-phosphate N-acetyltransferase